MYKRQPVNNPIEYILDCIKTIYSVNHKTVSYTHLYSADGERISFIKSKQRLIGQYMAQTLDEEWTQARGMEVFAVGMDISYTEDSQELINMRNKGAMLSDAAVQQGYVAANIRCV